MQHSCSLYNAFCSITWQTRMYLRTWQHKMTTIMQAFQCNLQPEIPQTHRTTHTQTHPKQLEATATVRQKKTLERTYPQLPHTRAALHRRLQPLYTEKHKVSCFGFLPNTSPMQHSCIHYNASCNQGSHNRKELRTHEDTQSAEHQGRTKNIKTSVPATASHTRCPSSLPAATLHGKTQGFVLQLPPQHKPPTLMQPFHCEFLQHSCNPFASLSLPYRFPTTSLPLPYHFPSSPLPLVTTSLSHHFPESPCSLRRHFP